VPVTPPVSDEFSLRAWLDDHPIIHCAIPIGITSLAIGAGILTVLGTEDKKKKH
jgi:hypothetical protein